MIDFLVALALSYGCPTETSWVETTAAGWIPMCGDASGRPIHPALVWDQPRCYPARYVPGAIICERTSRTTVWTASPE